jgi:23S rRNA (uracil1939-C5)-methyltransferase
MSERKYPVKRGGEYELQIEKLAFGGAGVARVENYVIFVKNTLPGDLALVRIGKRKKNYAEAKLLEIKKPSQKRISAPCSWFEWCGGCTWQNLSYENQLVYKREIVADSVKHIADIRTAVLPVIPSAEPFHYRNKMEFSFSDRRWLLPEELENKEILNDYALGLHVPGAFDKILNIDNCMLQNDISNAILKAVSAYVKKESLKPYGIRSHEGFMRFLVIRSSKYSGKIMVNLVTASENIQRLKPLAKHLMEKFPQIESIVNNINTKAAQIAVGEKEILLAGKAFIQERLKNFIFNISANSFFQTNTAQAETLYEIALQYAQIEKKDIVWDLYSGTGSISLFLAEKAKEVLGFEYVESSVKDAQKNAENHHIFNTKFIHGDLLYRLREAEPKPHIILTDPPRAGMHEKVVEYLNELRVQKIVYISCNPATLARDIALLSPVYEVKLIQPIDMFPQTYHIETVVKLELRKNG